MGAVAGAGVGALLWLTSGATRQRGSARGAGEALAGLALTASALCGEAGWSSGEEAGPMRGLLGRHREGERSVGRTGKEERKRAEVSRVELLGRGVGRGEKGRWALGRLGCHLGLGLIGFRFSFLFSYSTNSNYLNSNLNLNSTLALKQIKQCTSMNAHMLT